MLRDSDTKMKKKIFAFCLRLVKIWKIQWKTEQKNARFAETIKNDQMIYIFNENLKKTKSFSRLCVDSMIFANAFVESLQMINRNLIKWLYCELYNSTIMIWRRRELEWKIKFDEKIRKHCI